MFLDIVVVLTPQTIGFCTSRLQSWADSSEYPRRLDKYGHLRAFVRFGFLNLSHSQIATMQPSYGPLNIRKKIA